MSFLSFFLSCSYPLTIVQHAEQISTYFKAIDESRGGILVNNDKGHQNKWCYTAICHGPNSKFLSHYMWAWDLFSYTDVTSLGSSTHMSMC